MLPDNRLDFISNIDPQYIESMKNIRREFINLDSFLMLASGHADAKKEGASRCLSIARTNLETALQYTIKALCLMGEIKE